MCTIVILNQVSALAPVVLAANRDEFYARHARPPEPLPGTRAIAGIDEVGGGSWMGATADGFFVGLTNQRQGRVASGTRASRGDVVKRALALASSSQVRRYLEAIEPATFNPFNLLFGTADALHCAYVRDDGVRFETVPVGISVLPNDVLGSADFPKADRARALAAAAVAAAGSSWPALAAGLQAALASHEHAPREAFATDEMPSFPIQLRVALDALCIHTPAYGTRSFALVALAEAATVRYLHGEGPPCQTAPRDITDMVAAL